MPSAFSKNRSKPTKTRYGVSVATATTSEHNAPRQDQGNFGSSVHQIDRLDDAAAGVDDVNRGESACCADSQQAQFNHLRLPVGGD
jgi:hypothetical protein